MVDEIHDEIAGPAVAESDIEDIDRNGLGSSDTV
jgi:hypothetical protein